MANVTIEVPGIGEIQANNAATESTLRELVSIMSKMGGGGAAGGGGGGAAGGGGGGGTTSAPVKAAAGFAGKLGSATKMVTGFAGAAIGAAKAVGEFAGAMSNMIGDLANVDDSIQSAANSIPLLGNFFAPIAGAVEKSVGAFQKATASGATFGGSVNNMARAASAAGMTLDNFANLISQNGEAMRLLGGSTEDGANRFAQLSKQMRNAGFMTDLNNLGLSTQEVNEGMASYVKFLGQTGKLGNKSNAELAAGSAKYLKEMDLLAKVTGETRKDQEKARENLLKDAQFQAKVSSMSAEAGEAFANTVNGLPPGLRDVAKDIMVTGTATTEESMKFTAMMPKSAALMQKYAQITQAGGTITREMQQELQNTMAMEGKEKKLQFQTQGMYNKEMAGTYVQLTEAANIQTDGIKKASAAQEKSKKTTDSLAASSEAAKRTLASLSNSFTMMLANSGMLDSLMEAFGLFASFVQKIIFPIFQALSAVIGPLITHIAAVLSPVFTVLGAILSTVIVPVFQGIGSVISLVTQGMYAITDTLQDLLLPAFLMVSRIVDDTGKFIKDNFMSAIESVSDFFASVFKPVLDFITPPLRDVANYFRDLGDRIDVFFAGFNSLSDVTSALGIAFDELMIQLKEMWYGLRDFLPFLEDPSDEELEALAKEKEALAEEKTALYNRFGKQAEVNLKEQRKMEAQIAKEREARDKKFYGDKGAREAAAEAKKSGTAIDYSSPEGSLKSFAAQQKSPLAAAEAKKKEIEADTEKKKAEEQKAKEAAAAAPPTPVQESQSKALESLNNTMSELVKVTKETKSIQQRQLGVTEGMSGDVFSGASA